MILQSNQPIVLSAGGDTIDLDINQSTNLYIITGSATLSGSWVIQADDKTTPSFPLDNGNTGISFTFLYNAAITLNGHSITIFGRALTTQEALVDCLIIATCSSDDGSEFTVTVIPNFSAWALWITSGMFSAGAVDTAALEDGAATNQKIADSAITAAKVLIHTLTGDRMVNKTITATQLADHLITALQMADASVPTAALIDRNTTSAKIALLAIINELIGLKAVQGKNIDDSAVDTLQLNDGSVTPDKVENASLGASKFTATANTELVTCRVSFEAGEQTTYNILLPYACTVVSGYAQVTKVISGTDDGTAIFKNDAASVMTGGTITATAGTTLGTGFTITPTTNNTFTAGQFLKITTAKTTAGGVLQLSITIQRT